MGSKFPAMYLRSGRLNLLRKKEIKEYFSRGVDQISLHAKLLGRASPYKR